MNILDKWKDGMAGSTTETIVFEFLNEMLDRRGFDDWWSEVDDDTKVEILDSLVESIGKIHYDN